MLVQGAGDIGNRIANVEFLFNTFDSTGAPATMTGASIRVYREQSAVERTEGAALTVDYDSRTGLHRVFFGMFDSFYVSGLNYFAVLNNGTVDGVSVSGRVVASWGYNSRFTPLAAGAIAAGTFSPGAITASSIAANALDGKGDWLDAAGTRTAVGLAAANLDTQLAAITTIGSGASTVTLTITEDDNVTPIADADVWVTSTASIDAVVAGTSQTDSNGQVAFLLDDGATYFLWCQKDGITSIQGESFVASAD